MGLLTDRPSFVDDVSEFIHDPVLTLALRVDKKGVTSGVGDHDTVLNGKVVFGESYR